MIVYLGLTFSLLPIYAHLEPQTTIKLFKFASLQAIF